MVCQHTWEPYSLILINCMVVTSGMIVQNAVSELATDNGLVNATRTDVSMSQVLERLMKAQNCSPNCSMQIDEDLHCTEENIVNELEVSLCQMQLRSVLAGRVNILSVRIESFFDLDFNITSTPTPDHVSKAAMDRSAARKRKERCERTFWQSVKSWFGYSECNIPSQKIVDASLKANESRLNNSTTSMSGLV